MKNNRHVSLTLAALGVFFASLAAGQIKIIETIEPGNTKPVPVSISGFTGEAEDVIKFDLYVQGFSFTAPDAAQYLLSGSNSGNLVGRATDRISNAVKVNRSYTGGSLRRQAHAFVEDFIRSLGMAIHKPLEQSRKIALKVDTGKAGEIYVADFDGHGAQAITHDNAIVAAPAWVPGRLALCYTSYRSSNPDILLQDLSTGQRSVVAAYPGSNLSPAPSPDGSKVAMILSKSGAVDLWVGNLNGGGLKQLTKNKEDESSPCWSPDGQWICFATKINGRRTLCKVPAAGGPVQRVATSGVSNPSEPDWSPDGKWIVFTTTRRGGFDICVVPATGGQATVLVGGEDPSWAPNSRTVVFANGLSGSRRLSLLDVPTKQVKDVSRISGSNSQPSWAK